MSNTSSVADTELAKILESESTHGRFRVLRWLIAVLALALIGGGFAWFRSGSTVDAAPRYQTESLS